jgi:phage gpG-like protein
VSEIVLVGVDDAMADLRRWADEVAPAVAKAAEPFAARVAEQAAGAVPVVSGQLAGSIESSSDVDGVAVGYDGSVPYDGWIEFGGTRGRPYVSEGRYLYPTALAAADEFAQVASDAADDLAGRFSWSTPQA